MAKNDIAKQIKEDIIKEFNSKEGSKKILQAFQRAEKRCNDDIQRLIKQKMIETYYADYKQIHYVRTNQLHTALKPYTELIVQTNGFGFDLGVTEYDDSGEPLYANMDHGVYKTMIKYKTKGGQTRTYTYEIDLNNPKKGNPLSETEKLERERAITQNLKKNIHGIHYKYKGSHNLIKEMNREIDRIFDKKLDQYVDEEIAKIL